MIAALLYLQFRSHTNRVVAQIKRLKKPKYLAGFVVGGAYFYFYFFRYLFHSRPGRGGGGLAMSPDFLSSLEIAAALLVLAFLLFKWIFPSDRAALSFTETEVNFLFPAPVSRRTLIHFKLLKAQAGILLTTLLLAFLSNRFGKEGNAWLHIAGWWLLFSTLSLHTIGASFARTRLLDHGITHGKRRAIILLALAIAVGGILLWARQRLAPPTEAELADPKALWGYVRQVLTSGPAFYILFPFRLLVRPFLAQDVSSFLATFGPALAFLVAHYLWVIRSDVAFEEASVDLARKRAELIAAAKGGNLQPAQRKARREPFALNPLGSPAMAFLWKNLIAAGSMFTLRLWIILAFAFGLPAVIFSLNSRGTAGPPIVGMLLAMGLFWSLLAGPQILRQDFRQDLHLADVLKTYPLAGWRMVLGQLLAPALILAGVQWLLLLVAVIAVTHGPEGMVLPISTRLSVGAGAAMILPMLGFASLLIPNAAVLLFPSWFQSGPERTHGLEATGQRLIVALAQLLVFLLTLLPAAATFALIFFLLQFAVGWTIATPIACLASALMLAAETTLGIFALGKVFDRFDLSSEGHS